ncbi:ABC-ATPase domain-containing protein [Vibrio ulleungensis]|uniref:ABC-ATPase domain-containing protein n=1 Tax=Vibrio ulleungensis TaxID=2807619 RepID=A0ABS2HHN5_9VIBR|nr:ABC-ATPase domain-containing protein [Vibrio ulleungensis]MBM7035678.1 ABC-ATPase domain-containing protein [Vibrio ulleungensis]
MDALIAKLKKLEKQNYRAYQTIKGQYDFTDFDLLIDSVQADPYAGDSRFRAVRPWSLTGLAWLQEKSAAYQIAARDYLARQFALLAKQDNLISIATTGPVVLDNSAVLFTEQGIELRFRIKLPADGRLILGKKAANLITFHLPKIIRKVTLERELDMVEFKKHCQIIDEQEWLREQLDSKGLVSFVANGSTLPRESGDSYLPMKNAVTFVSPAELEHTFELPSGEILTGMGIPTGVTLIVGGGFHGKSTLLNAVEQSVYNHVPGDGRERIVTVDSATKIKAEDGRCIHSLNLSNFINHLPFNQSTQDFSTKDASGSTSQAAWLQESLDAGSRALLIDEDTSATNFMIRDQRMQALVDKSAEPITPLVDRVVELSTSGVSTIIVMGGSGDYLECADTVIQMHDYSPMDVTAKAKAVVETFPGDRQSENEQPFTLFKPRALNTQSLMTQLQNGKMRVGSKKGQQLRFGADHIDLSALEQLQSSSEINAIGWVMFSLAMRMDWVSASGEEIDALLAGDWRANILPHGDIATPRTVDVLSALNRYREATFKPAR